MKRTLAVCVGLNAAGAALAAVALSFVWLAKGHPLDAVLLLVFLALGIGLGAGAAVKTQSWVYRHLTEPNPN